ncbi:uncharacterized protein LOC141619101 [Silene latifolia]|uniref:uncharacterized protein LOC141619101 n=1 Tax=Silene latifolia TaxID=37657 RepID=UPI003D77BFB2
MKDTWSKLQLSNGYRKHVVRLHGVPKDIVSDRDARFISRFWQELQELMGTTLKMSTAFHPAAHGQTERTRKTLEDMSPICWDDSAEAMILGPEMVHEKLEQGVMRFGKKGKLSQKYIGSYEILDRVGEVAYRLALPIALDRVHNIFHASQLQKYVNDPSQVLEVEHIKLDKALTYVETPKEILDRKVRKIRKGGTVLLKVLWSNHKVEEATWEAEKAMRERYPHLCD